jgi:hypothetical protein
VVRAALREHLPPEPQRPRLVGAAAGPLAPGVDSANVKQWLRGEMAARLATRRADSDRR